MPGMDVVGARFELQSHVLGFPPPPVALRARLAKSREGWSLYVVPLAPTAPGAVLDWLSSAGPKRVEMGPNGVLRLDFAALPSAWAEAFHGVEIDMLRLATDGRADVSILGTRQAIQRFAARLAENHANVALSRVQPVAEPRKLLTDPQEEALRTAVRAGYYRIPRPLNLHELADQLGITAASLSERLRRAEARVITKYVEAGDVPLPAQREAEGEAPGLESAGRQNEPWP